MATPRNGPHGKPSFDYEAAAMPRRLQVGARVGVDFHADSIAGHPTAGVRKDVAMIGGYQTLEVDFTPELKGRSLFHCQMQSHMDYGFMALFDVV
jgi:FtsP/CotA-like multicopper oxidase with cupredoxin domain